MNDSISEFVEMIDDETGRKVLATGSGVVVGGIGYPVYEWTQGFSALPLNLSFEGINTIYGKVERLIDYAQVAFIVTGACSLSRSVSEISGSVTPEICKQLSIQSGVINTLLGALVGGSIAGIVAFRDKIGNFIRRI